MVESLYDNIDNSTGYHYDFNYALVANPLGCLLHPTDLGLNFGRSHRLWKIDHEAGLAIEGDRVLDTLFSGQ